ncbi:uncharacterized protein LOC143194730 [Rhynchophorus ferrugineus]|uniref:uncharacterized protein LOC143194730 n=1 Tax=Rhynchophorus ferrugineus TaxID=354439 RepID=UPI003FCC2940
MSSTQETHMLPPPKAKLSPLELRNTDLVSRLLAATPPYLYNMSLLPNTYFFSEMLRSFVQAKNEQNAQRNNMSPGFAGNSNMYFGHSPRRPKKRSWGHVSRESFPRTISASEAKIERSNEKCDNNEPWMIKSMRKSEETALELTTETVPVQKFEDHHDAKVPKVEDQPAHFPPQTENSTNLVLPPPPPIWYPPIYSTPPYGIDPLHFFIDLRVSGHIYDRQNNSQVKENSTNVTSSTVVSEKPQEKMEIEEKSVKIEEPPVDIFRQKRHSSAFSVPNGNASNKNRQNDKTQKRFDVKSMGFDKSSNKTGINYVMGHISTIYKNLNDVKQNISHSGTEPLDGGMAEHDITVDDSKNSVNIKESAVKDDVNQEESEAEKEKRVKDLRALIGLELVVDYMSHKKTLTPVSQDSSFSDGDVSTSEIESVGSPPLEVVDIQDDV